MRLALLSDIHANPLALETCLARADELGATQRALLGDLVGYGPDPAAVVDRVRALEAAGAWVLRGNHDTLAAAPPAEPKTVDEAGARWTHDQLDPSQRAWLAGLPLQRVEPPCFLVHASADAPEAWRYVNNPLVARDSLAEAERHEGIRYVLGGHVHLQALYYQGLGSTLMLFEPTPGKAIPVPQLLARHRRLRGTAARRQSGRRLRHARHAGGADHLPPRSVRRRRRAGAGAPQGPAARGDPAPGNGALNA